MAKNKGKQGDHEALLLRHLNEQDSEEGGARTARKDFDKSPLVAVYIALALLDNAIARAEHLTESGLAYVHEVLRLMGKQAESDDPTVLSETMVQLKSLVGDEEALKKQIANWKALRLVQIT